MARLAAEAASSHAEQTVPEENAVSVNALPVLLETEDLVSAQTVVARTRIASVLSRP